MGEIEGLDPRKPQRRPVLGEGRDRIGAGQKGAARALIDGPRSRCRHMNGRVRVGQPAQVGTQHIIPLLRRQVAEEGRVRIGEHRAQSMQEPVHLRPPAQEHAAQHQTAHPVRMRLRIGQRQRRTPGPTKQQPPLDPEVSAQRLDIGHQVRRRVLRQAAERAGTPGTPLIEDHHAPKARVEEAAVHGARARARAAVQEQHRLTARGAHLLPIHDVAAR